MAVTETRYEHVVLDEDQVPTIAGTPIKVEHVALEHWQYGWSAEELCYQHPGLTLGQVHSALAYYWDHRDEMDRKIQNSVAHVQNLRREAGPSPFVKRLKAQGLI